MRTSNAARVGLLSPDIVEEDTGSAEVRELFRVPKVGVIAGCYVTEGELHRDDNIRIVRNGTIIFEAQALPRCVVSRTTSSR